MMLCRRELLLHFPANDIGGRNKMKKSLNFAWLHSAYVKRWFRMHPGSSSGIHFELSWFTRCMQRSVYSVGRKRKGSDGVCECTFRYVAHMQVFAKVLKQERKTNYSSLFFGDDSEVYGLAQGDRPQTVQHCECFWMPRIFTRLWQSICLSFWHLESIRLLQWEAGRRRERAALGNALTPHTPLSLLPSVPPAPSFSFFPSSSVSVSWVRGARFKKCNGIR